MNITKRRGAAIVGVLALALIAAACGSDNSSGSSSATTTATTSGGAATSAGGAATTSGGATTTVKVSGTLQGSGSTFQTAFQQEAISEFTKKNSGATITYGGGGSGKGRTDLSQKVVDFAGSDSPFGASDKPADPILYFPVLLGPITMSYNVKGIDKLQLSPDTIAKIFSRTVKTWNDPAIAADNPGANLPSTNITVAHRSDGSGTTQNFTQYLMQAAPSSWTLGSGSTIQWPADTQAGNGNQGVAQIISQTDGGIGYVDLSDAVASKLSFASVKNSAGKFVEPTADSASAAGEGIDVKPDLTFSAINSPAPTAYPITYQTWVIVYQAQADTGKGQLLKAYLGYLLGDGQKLLVDLDYAPLSKTLQSKAVAQLDQLKIGA
ncbi:MAG TPA: phosphate ABC transporter substrate-binding protein PstS [Acidimicrobiales bacterium]|nr:phosphate ABC transporter substrate-binding protein PstS [Acidimicrobiales bacterium]